MCKHFKKTKRNSWIEKDREYVQKKQESPTSTVQKSRDMSMLWNDQEKKIKPRKTQEYVWIKWENDRTDHSKIKKHERHKCQIKNASIKLCKSWEADVQSHKKTTITEHSMMMN